MEQSNSASRPEQNEISKDSDEEDHAQSSDVRDGLQPPLYLNLIADSFLCINAGGMVVDARLRAEDHSLFRCTDVVGKHYRDVLLAELELYIAQTLERANACSAVQTYCYERQTPGESQRTYEFRTLGLEADSAVVIVRDTTEHRVAEEKIRELEGALAHAWRVSTMGEMVTVLAHEINQPLAAIVNYAGTCGAMLDSGISNPKDLRTVLGKIEAQSHRAGGIVNRLKRFVSKTAPRMAPACVNDVIQEVQALLGSQLLRRDATLALDLDTSLPAVAIDAIQIQQVLVNLVSNAAEAIDSPLPERREIRVNTFKKHNAVQVDIIDRGRGIDPLVAERLFEPFSTTKSDGMGMGLKISQQIIRSHGGELSTRPNPQGGTIFSFTLPVKS